MGTVLEKDVLYPGKWRLADGRTIAVTRADLANAVRQGNAMLAEGIPAPWCWEHNLDAFPATLSGQRNDWFAKGYFAKTLGLSLSTNKMGPHVKMKCDLFNDDDRNQLERVGKVSPMLVWDYVDERGKTWPGMTIAHVAATPKPIQRNQTNFAPAAMSGLAGRCRTFALLGEGKPVADKADDAPADDDVSDVDTPPENKPDGSSGYDAELIDLLGQLGVQVGEGVTDIDDLKGRLKALVASGVQAGTGGANGDDGMATASDVTSPAGVGPMVMSALPPAMQKAAAGIIEGGRKDLLKRVDALFESGRVHKPIRDSLANRVKSATLSLMNDGTLRKSELLIEIAAYEKLPANATWGKRQTDDPAALSGLRVVPKPEIGMSEEEVAAERQKQAVAVVGRKYGAEPYKPAV